jgi:hypothetical protein
VFRLAAEALVKENDFYRKLIFPSTSDENFNTTSGSRQICVPQSGGAGRLRKRILVIFSNGERP